MEKEESKTITVNLSRSVKDTILDPIKEQQLNKNIQPEPEPEPEIKEKIIPAYNADDFSSSNQKDKEKGDIVFGQKKADKLGEPTQVNESSSKISDQETAISNDNNQTNIKEQAENNKADTTFDSKVERNSLKILRNSQSEVAEKQLIDTQHDRKYDGIAKEQTSVNKPNYYDYFSGLAEQEGEAKQLEARIVDDTISSPGNIAMLADTEMRDISVEQPFSELKSQELKIANEFLARMNKQVLAVWNNPYKGNHLYRGIAKFELNEEGFLQDVYIYRTSGHPALDESVLKAIISVPRFNVPENKVLANRYYSHLRFYYSSVNNKTELMPFEKVNDK